MNKYLEDLNNKPKRYDVYEIKKLAFNALRQFAFSRFSINTWVFLSFTLIVPLISWIISWVLVGEELGINKFDLMLFIVAGSCSWVALASTHIAILSMYSISDYYSGSNDNEKSIMITSNVIKESKKWIAFYDYGENNKDNIYSSELIRDLLIDKLSAKKPFEVSMVFTKGKKAVDKLFLVKELRKWEKNNKKHLNLNGSSIKLAYAKSSNKHDTHYKINDTDYAFLTKHRAEDQNRSFEYFTPYAARPIEKINRCLVFHNDALKNKEV